MKSLQGYRVAERLSDTIAAEGEIHRYRNVLFLFPLIFEMVPRYDYAELGLHHDGMLGCSEAGQQPFLRPSTRLVIWHQ